MINLNPAPADIGVCRVPEKETSVVAAAKAWARALAALETKQQCSGDGETAELSLHDAIADADALKSAELALYATVLASGLMSR